jgi:hypothetical protein
LAVEIAAFAAVSGAAFLLFFSHRSDYAGHYLAGLGATLMMLGAVLWASGRAPGWFGIVLVVVAILFGVATEATVFRIAIFDPVDFVNQSLGAIAAGWLMSGVSRRRCGLTAAAIGLLVLFFGFLFAFT